VNKKEREKKMTPDAMNKAAARENHAYTVYFDEPTRYAFGNNGRGTLTVPVELGKSLAKRFPGSMGIAKARTETVADNDKNWNALAPGEYLTWTINGHGANAWRRFCKEENVSFKTWSSMAYRTSPMSETYWSS
jgi:hypothetical protein